MAKIYSKALFVFRRDLRCDDNIGLAATLDVATQVIPCFILDPRQIEPHPYQSKPALQYMLEALGDLDLQLRVLGGRLQIFQGLPEEIVKQLQRDVGIEAVFVNRDYTPFSRRRDAELEKVCRDLGISFLSHADLLLNEPEQVVTEKGAPYQVFTAFYKRASQNSVAFPKPLVTGRFLDTGSPRLGQAMEGLRQPHQNPLAGGRRAALALLYDLGRCRDYSLQRDFPAQAATSELSVYLKFGCCSVREAYYAIVQQLGEDHTLLRQLYWRDFFSHIAWHFPHVFGHAFHRQYDAIAWRNDRDQFQRWADGNTGFPIIDAGMRQLKQTGAMHNRVRMIVASFLVKDLHISWRWGERYFAQHLLDYDPCLNNGNWQWAASTGCDAQPYFRIFNPWLQQRKFDPDCAYVKQWVPELRGLSAEVIHNWYKKPLAGAYPAPMLDHAARSQQAKSLFQQANLVSKAS